jgi:hypothetical protein
LLLCNNWMLMFGLGCNVLQAGRFMLGAQELQLPVAATAPLGARLEALRQLLRQKLGADVFQRWVPQADSNACSDA